MKKVLSVLLCLLLLLLPTAAWCEGVTGTAQPFQIDLTPLFQAIIALMAALVTGRLLPWIKARTTREQQERLQAITRTLVYAADQLYKTGLVKDRLGYVQDGLLARGYTIDRDAIEASVREMRWGEALSPVITVTEEKDHE